MQKTEKEEIDYLNIEQKIYFQLMMIFNRSIDDDLYIHLLISMNGTIMEKKEK